MKKLLNPTSYPPRFKSSTLAHLVIWGVQFNTPLQYLDILTLSLFPIIFDVTETCLAIVIEEIIPNHKINDFTKTILVFLSANTFLFLLQQQYSM